MTAVPGTTFVAQFTIRLGGLVGKGTGGLQGNEFESRVWYFVFLLHFTFKFITDISFLCYTFY